MSGKGQQQEKKKTNKRRRVHRFHEPRVRRVKSPKRLHTCLGCGAKVRVNGDKLIAWHRDSRPTPKGKWCKRSRTKLELS